MSIDSDLASTLASTLSSRLWPMEAPANVARPYGIYQLVSLVPTTHLAGVASLTNYRYQVDLFGPDPGALATLGSSVRTAMSAASAFKSICLSEQELFDDVVQLFRRSIDFSIWQ